MQNSFKNERDIKTFPGKGKIFASICAVQEKLKEIPGAAMKGY